MKEFGFQKQKNVCPNFFAGILLFVFKAYYLETKILCNFGFGIEKNSPWSSLFAFFYLHDITVHE